MAIFFPDMEPDPEKSSAEYRCFKALKGLSDKWVVLHSVYLHSHQYKRSAEADFVLISDRAIMTIEVKGGRVVRRGGSWIYINKYGQESEKRESPYQQAETAMHAIRDRVTSDPAIDRIFRKIAIGWGCYMPDVALPDVGATEWPREMICDSIRLGIESLPSTIEAMERYVIRKEIDLGHRPPTALSKDERDKLVKSIRKDFESMISVSPLAAHAEVNLWRMTESQADVFWGLAEYNSRVLVFGPAGTGKTLIAHKHFNTLLVDNPELRVGLVCFNAILADYLGSLNPHHANSDRAFVGTVYQLLRAACPSLSKDKSDLTACAGEAQAWANANPSKLFDVLIVDEGQDLRPLPAICESLGHLIRGGWGNGRWAWFEDLGQSIIRGSKGIFEPPAACQFPLRQNVRNTERIADTANAIGRNKATNSKVYGLEVDYRVHEHDDSESRLRDLDQAVSDLIKSGFPPSDIVVLDYSGGNELLERSGKIANIKAAPWSLGARKDTVRYSTVRKFKGMESRAVIVYNINAPLAADDPLLYVSVTRPVFSLTLIMDPEARTAMAMAMLRSQTA